MDLEEGFEGFQSLAEATSGLGFGDLRLLLRSGPFPKVEVPFPPWLNFNLHI